MTGERRLPVFFLLDCSAAMNGPPREALREGVESFAAEAKRDAFARETVYIGIITFGGAEAHLVTQGLIPVEQFAVPDLILGDERRPLGAALRVLDRAIDEHVLPSRTGGPRGDWRPLIIILSGTPTDDWQEPHRRLLTRPERRPTKLILVGSGPDIDRATLKSIGFPVMLDESNAVPRSMRRERIGGIPRTSGFRPRPSCMLAPEMPSDRGRPFRSVIRWIFDPFLPRSVGFGPVSGSLLQP